MTKKIATVATVPPVLQLLLRGTVATVQNLKTKKVMVAQQKTL